MRKTIFIILVCGILVIGLVGCGRSKNKIDIGEPSDIQTSQRDIVLSIKEGTLTNIGATLILENNSDQLLHYDDSYEIEIKKDVKWYKVNAEIFFNEPLFDVEEGKSKELDLKWEYGYGKLPRGKYRIVKKVYFENDREQELYISVEFNIDSD